MLYGASPAEKVAPQNAFGCIAELICINMHKVFSCFQFAFNLQDIEFLCDGIFMHVKQRLLSSVIMQVKAAVDYCAEVRLHGTAKVEI